MLSPLGSSGDTKLFYDHQENPTTGAFIDTYKEVYNWPYEWMHYKIIYTYDQDLSNSLVDDSFLQTSIMAPLLVEYKNTRSTAKGEYIEHTDQRVEWGTASSKIHLLNGTYNTVSGHLLENIEEYTSDEILAPFIKELYFDSERNGNKFELQLKRALDAQSERATDVFIVKVLNKIYNTVRRSRFRRQFKKTGPLVIAEGDSWFLFPKPGVKDTIDYLLKNYRILSLADAGDEISDYLKNGELINKVEKFKPDFVLISGGGNDIVGPEIKEVLNTNYNGGDNFEQLLNVDKFEIKLNLLRDGYSELILGIMKLSAKTKIFIHGYDYILSNPSKKVIKSGWANKYMIEVGIKDEKIRRSLIKYLIDSFNDMLADFSNTLENVFYVDNRGTVNFDEWMDEIHPNNSGYQKIANNFINSIEDALK